jgi:nitroreductase
MDVIDCIKSRRSIRKFLPNKIPEPILHEILDAANAAPCAGNLQSWRFLVVEKEEAKKVIAKSALDQDWIATAPVVVLVLSDNKALEEEYGSRGATLYDIQNAALAAENLMLAAWNFGIGSTYVGAFTEAKLRKELRIPDSIKIHAIIPLGYPTEMPSSPGKIDVANLTHVEHWGRHVSITREAKEGFIYPSAEAPRVIEKLKEKTKKTVKKIKEKVGKLKYNRARSK